MRIGRERAHNRWHPALEPVATVKPGDEITLDCEDGIGGQLTRESEHADAGRIDLGAAHPITGLLIQFDHDVVIAPNDKQCSRLHFR